MQQLTASSHTGEVKIWQSFRRNTAYGEPTSWIASVHLVFWDRDQAEASNRKGHIFPVYCRCIGITQEEEEQEAPYPTRPATIYTFS